MPSVRNSNSASSPAEPLNCSLFPAKSLVAEIETASCRKASLWRVSPLLRRRRNGARRRSLVQIAICVAAIFVASSTAAQPSAGVRPAPPRGRPACPPAARPFAVFVTEAAQRFSIPESWIRAVMRVESFGDARAVSPKGAIGLMQIMPKTYAELRVRHRLGADPCDPHDNVLAGAAYLREMLDRYGAPGFLAAYNAGPARYDEHLMKGRPLPGETQDYVAKLAPMIGVQQGEDQKGAAFDLLPGCKPRCFRRTQVRLRAQFCLQSERSRIVPRPSVASSIFRRSPRVPKACSSAWRVRRARDDRPHTPSHARRAYRRFGIERGSPQGLRPWKAR
jgi:Transglycosylase SLT domain